MTEPEINRTASKVSYAIASDKRTKEAYNNYWLRKMCRFLLVPIAYYLFFFILRTFIGGKAVHAWGLITGIMIDLPVMFALFSCLDGKAFRTSDGKSCSSPIGIVCKCICAFCAFSPFVFMIYGMFYNSAENRCAFSIDKLLIYSPIIFKVVLLYSLFMDTPSPYSEKTDTHGRAVMTKMDYIKMRQDQELAGLDPDKIPVILSPSQIKKMSKLDWYQLGLDLEIAGYDVFKKKGK